MPKQLESLMRRTHDPRLYRRMPGLYRRWELERIIEPEAEYAIEKSGQDIHGVDLFAVFRRERMERIAP